MPINIEISELSAKEKASVFIDSYQMPGLITTKMLNRNFNIKPKQCHHLLKYHKDTVLETPYSFGSHKHSNYNLYKKVTDEEKINICNHEIDVLTKNKKNVKEFIDSGAFKTLMYNKYRLIMTYEILDKLDY